MRKFSNGIPYSSSCKQINSLRQSILENYWLTFTDMIGEKCDFHASAEKNHIKDSNTLKEAIDKVLSKHAELHTAPDCKDKYGQFMNWYSLIGAGSAQDEIWCRTECSCQGKSFKDIPTALTELFHNPHLLTVFKGMLTIMKECGFAFAEPLKESERILPELTFGTSMEDDIAFLNDIHTTKETHTNFLQQKFSFSQGNIRKTAKRTTYTTDNRSELAAYLIYCMFSSELGKEKVSNFAQFFMREYNKVVSGEPIEPFNCYLKLDAKEMSLVPTGVVYSTEKLTDYHLRIHEEDTSNYDAFNKASDLYLAGLYHIATMVLYNRLIVGKQLKYAEGTSEHKFQEHICNVWTWCSRKAGENLIQLTGIDYSRKQVHWHIDSILGLYVLDKMNIRAKFNDITLIIKPTKVEIADALLDNDIIWHLIESIAKDHNIGHSICEYLIARNRDRYKEYFKDMSEEQKKLMFKEMFFKLFHGYMLENSGTLTEMVAPVDAMMGAQYMESGVSYEDLATLYYCYFTDNTKDSTIGGMGKTTYDTYKFRNSVYGICFVGQGLDADSLIDCMLRSSKTYTSTQPLIIYPNYSSKVDYKHPVLYTDSSVSTTDTKGNVVDVKEAVMKYCKYFNPITGELEEFTDADFRVIDKSSAKAEQTLNIAFSGSLSQLDFDGDWLLGERILILNTLAYIHNSSYVLKRKERSNIYWDLELRAGYKMQDKNKNLILVDDICTRFKSFSPVKGTHLTANDLTKLGIYCIMRKYGDYYAIGNCPPVLLELDENRNITGGTVLSIISTLCLCSEKVMMNFYNSWKNINEKSNESFKEKGHNFQWLWSKETDVSRISFKDFFRRETNSVLPTIFGCFYNGIPKDYKGDFLANLDISEIKPDMNAIIKQNNFLGELSANLALIFAKEDIVFGKLTAASMKRPIEELWKKMYNFSYQSLPDKRRGDSIWQEKFRVNEW